ncbi:MAG: threonine/serine exporter family protein [Myxococcota bacterium]
MSSAAASPYRSIGEVTDLLLELGRALHEAGAPAHRIEDTMGAVARAAGIEAQIVSQPTLLMCSFGEGEQARTRVQRVSPTEYDLARLMAVDDVLEKAAVGKISPKEAVLELRTLKHRRYPRWTIPVAYLALGTTVAILVGGSVYDATAAALISTLIGLVSLGRWRTPHLLNLTSAILASVAGALVNRAFGGSPANIALASLIVLVPGLTLTQGLVELATRHLVSGTSRLMAALIVFLELGFGVALGQQIVEVTMGPAVPIAEAALPAWSGFFMVLPATLALVVFFNAPLKRTLVIVTSVYLGFVGARLGSAWLGPLLGAGLGSFLIGAFANVYARTFREPASLALVPAVLLLVPGSIGYRSLESFIAADTTQAINAVFATFVIATSIVSGILVANTAIAPRRLL